MVSLNCQLEPMQTPLGRESQEGLSRTSWSVDLSVGDCLDSISSCGKTQPTMCSTTLLKESTCMHSFFAPNCEWLLQAPALTFPSDKL